VPDELVDRPKQGFGIPIYEWCFERLGDHMRDTTARFCRETDLFDGPAVADLVARRPGQPAWSLYNLALWWEKFVA
jgi:asparagine synthase (glutamine-hydrolysing)